jgi:protein TonB
VVNRVEQGPILIEKPAAAYPALAKEARIQGVVLFRLLIDAEGRVENVTLLSGHPLLVPAATEAVRRYRYQPTMRDGQPVKVRANVGVPFVLQ